MSTKLVCKKCQGNHLTIKCGKNKIKTHDKNNFQKKNNFQNTYKKYCVKISNLPNDITIKEMTDLIIPWSPKKGINRINFSKSKDKVCYIDFLYKEESDYFIEALDNTKFDNLIINVEYV
jgi:RNA recognition motif-containing protein